MAIKATLKQLIGSAAGMQSLLAAKLPIKAKYSVSKLASAIDKEIETFQAARKAIFDAAECKVVDNAYVHADPAVLAKAVAEAEELGGAEVELNALPLDLDQFGNGDIDGPAFYGLEWAMQPPKNGQ